MSDTIPATTPARWFLGAVGFFLILLGLGFTAWLWHAGERAMVTRHWAVVPGTVLVSGMKMSQFSEYDPVKWQPELEYRYAYGGRIFHGSKVRRVEGPSPHRERVEATVDRYPTGAEVSCLVNPENPAEAVLEHSTKAPFYTLWWPMLFAAGGTGMVRAALRRNSGNFKTISQSS